MKIGFVSFRLAGTDGVSLETAKVAQIFSRSGHEIFYFAGELDPPAAEQGHMSVPLAGTKLAALAHFTHAEIVWISSHAFGTRRADPDLRVRMENAAAALQQELESFIDQYKIDVLVAQNVFAIPMNIPLSMALRRVVAERQIPCIAHSHDFYWERERYDTTCVDDILASTFPPQMPNVRHLVINTQAQRALAERGIESEFVPNIFDYTVKPPGIDSYASDLRQEMGLQEGELFFLQPTRVIRRKGIELSIELVRRLADLPIKLYITHHAEYDTLDYLGELLALAARQNVRLYYLPNRFAPQRSPASGIHKIYSLWDAYIQADFVTYPSLYEGFGNALLETLYFRKPLLVNRYQIYQDDIEPTGIQAITIDEVITDETVDEVRMLLQNPARIAELTNHNFRVAQEHFSYEAVEPKLHKILNSF